MDAAFYRVDNNVRSTAQEDRQIAPSLREETEMFTGHLIDELIQLVERVEDRQGELPNKVPAPRCIEQLSDQQILRYWELLKNEPTN
jgi:hypothetical protein